MLYYLLMRQVEREKSPGQWEWDKPYVFAATSNLQVVNHLVDYCREIYPEHNKFWKTGGDGKGYLVKRVEPFTKTGTHKEGTSRAPDPGAQ